MDMILKAVFCLTIGIASFLFGAKYAVVNFETAISTGKTIIVNETEFLCGTFEPPK